MKLKVITFNIRCWSDDNGNSIPERAPRLKLAVTPYDADVMGFQEMTPAWEEFIEEYGDRYEIFNKWRCEDKPESAPLLWKKDKFTCIKKGYFWYSDTPEVSSLGWDEVYHQPRICMFAHLKANESGEEFCVFNTHFGFGDDGQVKSVNLIDKKAKELSDLPTFVMGDFNMKPDSPAYKRMIEIYRDANKETLNDFSGTFHRYGTENPYRQIDYCFINEKVTPKHTEIIRTTFDGMYPSDHFGIYFELNV